MYVEFYRGIKNITESAFLLSNMITFHKGRAVSGLFNLLVEMQPQRCARHRSVHRWCSLASPSSS